VTGGELAQFGRTAAHLRPAQIAHRARLRAQRTALHRWPQASQWLLTGPGGPDSAAAPGWPAAFTPLDGTALTMTAPRHWPSLGQLQAGRIRLLGVTRQLTRPRRADGSPAARLLADWRQADAPQLWRFQLHYWDWAWGLAAEPDRAAARELFAALWQSWRDTCAFGLGDAWMPYPTALRAWSWCGLYRDLMAGTGLASEFRRDIAAHAGFLRRHLESDVGGNHLIKNLKALAGLAVFLADEPLLRKALRLLAEQITTQVLPDGGHYERAPAYHCQVLADLIDIDGLLAAASLVPPPALTGAIARMRRWLGVVQLPDGSVPLLNDGYAVPGTLVTALRPAGPPVIPLVTLGDTGLIRAALGEWHLLADAGPPCPDELPAHAHADTLSCVLHAGGFPLLIDTGTSTYQAGTRRSYERSTAAHNTIEIDGADSTEVWSAFRAGRRARVHGPVVRSRADWVSARAAHDGYRFLTGRPVHRRQWNLSRDRLEVTDEVTGGGRHSLAVRWHLAPGSQVELGSAGAIVSTPGGQFAMTLKAAQPLLLDLQAAPAAVGFLHTTTIPVLICRLDTMLPARLSTTWRRADRALPGPRQPV
jgi:uncharacterized heparinase superfamily protein